MERGRRTRLIPAVLLIVACTTGGGPQTAQPPSSAAASPAQQTPAATPQRSKEATPGATATPAATPAATAAATSTLTTTATQAATPVITPAATPVVTPATTPVVTAVPSPTGAASAIATEADEILETLTGGRFGVPAGVAVLEDPPNDLFTFGTEVGTTTPWIDVLAGVGFLVEFDAELADYFSTAFDCPIPGAGGIRVAGTPPWTTSCNTNLPLEQEMHALILTGWNGVPPDPFPMMANCSWAVQTNVDDDLGTGFPNPPPGHPLMGAEIYHEMLMFYSQDGQFRNYNLATDYREPPRTDTGQQQGNLGTRGRSVVVTEATRERMWVLDLVPVEDFGPNWGAHGYCFGDVENRQESLAVDAFNPFEGAEAFYDLLDEIFPPRD